MPDLGFRRSWQWMHSLCTLLSISLIQLNSYKKKSRVLFEVETTIAGRLPNVKDVVEVIKKVTVKKLVIGKAVN